MRLCWQSNNWSNIDSEDQTANSEPSNCTARPFLPRYRLYTSNYIARPCVNWKHWRLFVMCSQSCLIQEFLLEVFSFYSVCRNSHIAQWGEKKMLKQQKQPGGSVDRNLWQKIDKATASHLPDAYSWHLSMSPHMTLSLSTACEVLPHL